MNHKSNILRALVLALALLWLPQGASGQQVLKFKDVYDQTKILDRAKAYALLQQYQRQDPELAAAYYQLGTISSQWMREYDPLAQSDLVKLFAYNTALYYGLAKLKLDEGAARRDNEFFDRVQVAEGARKREWAEIVAEIDGYVADAKTFGQNHANILGHHRASVEFYNQCVATFRGINARFDNGKELYLMADELFLSELSKLEQAYDSFEHHFGAYQAAIRAYPMGGYDQRLKVMPIETYRLDGLTSFNFLLPEIQVWDYKAWCAETRRMLNTEIADLRGAISNAYWQTSQSLDIMTPNLGIDRPADFRPYAISDTLLFKIGKYDFQSWVVEYFQLMRFNLAMFEKGHFSLQDFISKEWATGFDQLTREISQAQAMLKQVEDQAKVLSGFLTPENHSKHPGLADKETFASFDESLVDFSVMRWSAFTNDYAYLAAHLRFGEHQEHTMMNGEQMIKLGLPAAPGALPTTPGYYLTDYERDDKGLVICGFQVPADGGASVAFVGASADGQNLGWFKTLASPDRSANMATSLSVSQDVVALAVANPGGAHNQALRFDREGKSLAQHKATSNLGLRELAWDDINERGLLVSCGIDPLGNAAAIPGFSIELLDATGKSLWKVEGGTTGSYAGQARMGDLLWVFFNSNGIIGANGAALVPTNPRNRACALALNADGAIVGTRAFADDEPFFIHKVVKIDSETIGLATTYSLTEPHSGRLRVLDKQAQPKP